MCNTEYIKHQVDVEGWGELNVVTLESKLSDSLQILYKNYVIFSNKITFRLRVTLSSSDNLWACLDFTDTYLRSVLN